MEFAKRYSRHREQHWQRHRSMKKPPCSERHVFQHGWSVGSNLISTFMNIHIHDINMISLVGSLFNFLDFPYPPCYSHSQQITLPYMLVKYWKPLDPSSLIFHPKTYKPIQNCTHWILFLSLSLLLFLSQATRSHPLSHSQGFSSCISFPWFTAIVRQTC